MRTLTFLAACLLLTFAPAAQALPGTPYCPGSVGPIAGAPSVFDPAVCETVTGRVFPEASALSTPAGQMPAQDFVSFFEFETAIEYLAAQYPDWMTIHNVGTSFGFDNPAGGRDQFPVYLLEITNKNSPMPMEERQSLLFMLSIHGVEKGGREGGFRVLEDLVKGIGFATETVQDGTGLATPLVTPTGKEVATYRDYLDFQRVFLLFPNPDGWAHDELPYVATTSPSCGAPPNGALFCRTNGNGVDLNRQAPTTGWQNPSRNPVGEPEAVGYYNWLLTNNITWAYAIDIHGMLNHQNFVAIMMPAASMTPQEMQRSVRLAESLKDRLNNDEHFSAWRSLFGNAETGQGAAGSGYTQACQMVDCPLPGSALRPSEAAGSSVLAEYYTVIDAIGYTDSGFNGDYFAQDRGLNAPGYDIELAYNHITVDSAYPGLGAILNDYHVKAVREITKSFMDAAALDVRISFETGGLRTLYLEPTFVATSLDDEEATPGGWADENTGDDIWDYGVVPFTARPAKYWEDLQPFLRNGDEPGVLVKTSASEVTNTRLGAFDTFVIPGSAIKDLERYPAAVETVRAWVEGGGTLVLTDEALRFFDLAGITDGAVDSANRYMGGIKMDLTHPLLAKVRGGVMQMYEPTPLGYQVGANAAPNWFLDEAKFLALGGEVAGRECGSTILNNPACDTRGIALGQVAVGAGQVRFMGALLPDPTEEFYHPYGLDPYATTYSGNQVLRNLLGWDERFEAPPVVISDAGKIIQSPNEPTLPPATGAPTTEADVATPALPVALLALGLLAAVRVRRR